MASATDLAPCGTVSAALRHRRRGEFIDQACVDAERAWGRDRRYAEPGRLDREAWWQKTRQRAYKRLAAEYPERFAELIAEERATDTPWDGQSSPSTSPGVGERPGPARPERA